jgi:hypothetical protein
MEMQSVFVEHHEVACTELGYESSRLYYSR